MFGGEDKIALIGAKSSPLGKGLRKATALGILMEQWST